LHFVSQLLKGYFDLDPTRTVDIILDVFSEQLVNHHAFFRDLLAASPWSRGRTSVMSEVSMEVDDVSADKGKGRAIPDGTLPVQSGNSVVAQVLGFKFKNQQVTGILFREREERRYWWLAKAAHLREVEKLWQRKKGEYKPGDQPDITPPKLYLLAAVLIWDGFIKISDLYPHLSPSDEELAGIEAKFGADMASQAGGSGSNSKLANFGALDEEEDSTSKAAQKEEPKAEAPKELPNQKVPFVQALLNVGAFSEAIFLLSRFPFLSGPFPGVADSLLRLLTAIITPAFTPLSLEAQRPEVLAALTHPRQRYSVTDKKLVDIPPTQPVLSSAIEPQHRGNVHYVYFWAEWPERLPSCTTAEDVVEVVGKLLRFVGSRASLNHNFLAKILRIAAADCSVCQVKPNAGSPHTDSVDRISPTQSSIDGGISSACISCPLYRSQIEILRRRWKFGGS
jgi:THO complex subunit 2